MRQIKTASFLVILLTITFNALSQATTKEIVAVRTSLPVKLDGVPDEEAWKATPGITDFMEIRPHFGRPENEASRSQTWLLYDDEAIYFAGIFYEKSRDSISAALVGRDQIGINDFAGIIIDTYQDKINGLGFFVTPMNEQYDAKYSIGNNNGEDDTWNTVYHTAAQINDAGWSFEMKIPYSALRFAKKEVQDWNIHMLRKRTKTGQQYSWSPVDPNKFGLMNQAGTWKGLTNLQPPLRLSFSPYFSAYLNKNPETTNKWKPFINGGMDIKYGLTDAFTLDMTLIPDFGQVQSDNQVLNLTPFEVKFTENRQFFNEGTELFNKANLFYSRRIGGSPFNYSNNYGVPAGHHIKENPAQTKLLNATKISGRTRQKLGIGFFNAITRREYAVIEDENKEEYKIQTNPLTNYNIIVLDQGLKNNSRVTLVNTNTLRSGSAYDANVTALDWDLYDKNVNWNVWGNIKHSRLVGYKEPGKTYAGTGYEIYGGKFKGRFNFELHRFVTDDKYNQNDLGYFTNNNYVTHGGGIWYKWVKPKSFYNNIFFNSQFNYTQLYEPRRYQDFRFNFNMNSQLKNLWIVGVFGNIAPKRNDFYEPRKQGRMVEMPGTWMKGIFINTNQAKKYSASLELAHRSGHLYKTSNKEINITNRYRFGSKLSISLTNNLEFSKNDFGFAFINDAQDSIFMSLRNRKTAENVFNITYNLSNKMWLTFRTRHYWSKVKYHDFMNLNEDGSVTAVGAVSKNPDINVNLFNIDVNYTWQIAAGSFVNFNWKTASALENKLVEQRYFKNLGQSAETPAFNSVSIKVIYFLDYLALKKKDGIK